MADVQYWDDILTQEMGELHILINDEIPAITDRGAKAEAFSQAESKLKSASKTKKTLKMETRLVTDTQTRKLYEERHARLGDELSHHKADLSALKQDFEREQLMHGSGSGANAYEMDEEDGQKAGDRVLGEAHKVQDQTQSALDNIRQNVDEAKEVGMSSLEELKRQRETMDRIGDEADRIDSALDVAEKLIKNFGKRMAGDKFIQCITVFNVLLLVGVIIYASVSGKSSKPAEPAAPSNPFEPATAPEERRYLRSAFKLPELLYD